MREAGGPGALLSDGRPTLATHRLHGRRVGRPRSVGSGDSRASGRHRRHASSGRRRGTEATPSVRAAAAGHRRAGRDGRGCLDRIAQRAASALVPAAPLDHYAFREGEDDWRSAAAAEAARLTERGLEGRRMVTIPGGSYATGFRSRACVVTAAVLFVRPALHGGEAARPAPGASARRGEGEAENQGRPGGAAYSVRSGDTLAVIAERFRYDPSTA